MNGDDGWKRVLTSMGGKLARQYIPGSGAMTSISSYNPERPFTQTRIDRERGESKLYNALKNMGARAISGTVAGDMILKPRLNTFGEPIIRTTTGLLANKKNRLDPVLDELERLGVAGFNQAGRYEITDNFGGKARFDFNYEDTEAGLKGIGPFLRNAISSVINNELYKRLPDELKKKHLTDMIAEAKKSYNAGRVRSYTDRKQKPLLIVPRAAK